MSARPTLTVKTGTVGGTPINADLLNPGTGTHPWDIKKVTLSADYVRVHPPGFPAMPPAGGEVKSRVTSTSTITNGTTVSVYAHEAAALVAAGAAAYA